MTIFTPVPGILGVGNQRCQSWDASRTHRHQSWILKLVILMLAYLQLNMVDRTRTTFIKWLMRNYSSWAWIHLFFVEFVVPSVVHLAPFPPTEKTISVWIWEQLSHWLPYSQIVCRVSWFWRSQNLTSADLVFPSVAPVVLHFVLHCGKGVAQLGLEGLRRKVSLADYGNSSSGRE